MKVNVFDTGEHRFKGGELSIEGTKLVYEFTGGEADSDLYLSPGFIDMHTHCFYGGAYLGVKPDDIGLRRGVHLCVDAGSSGAHNYISFRDYVAPAFRTKVVAFLNISAIGLATGQPYHDMRYVDPQATADCVREDGGRFIVGIKVLSSRVRVEEARLEPLIRAIEAAGLCDVPVMAHLSEGPPYNEETLPLLRRGDIISHAFHGDKSYEGHTNLMFNYDGSPTPLMGQAIKRGVIVDVGHGSASMDAHIARAVVESGMRDFIISTDLHTSSIKSRVYGMPETMSKFLNFGMSVSEVVDSVTMKSAAALRLASWGEDLTHESTLFRVRNEEEGDNPLEDSVGNRIEGKLRIAPVGCVVGGVYTDIKHL